MTGEREGKDGAAVRFPPPVVYVLAILAGIGLQALLPLRAEPGRSVRLVLAVFALVLGVALMAGAIRLFRKTGQDPKPWVETPEIIRDGVYRFTRNPMYVSLALLQIALGLGVGNVWIVLLAPMSCTVVYFIAIRPEEAYLATKFGDGYLDYKRSVRRWF